MGGGRKGGRERNSASTEKEREKKIKRVKDRKERELGKRNLRVKREEGRHGKEHNGKG